MDLVFQSLVGLVILALVALGTMSMFLPQKMAKNFAIEPVGAAGLNSIRSMIAGPIVAGIGLLIFGLATGQTLSFLIVAIIVSVTIFGRIVGILADGFDREIVPPLITEAVIVAILFTAYTQL